MSGPAREQLAVVALGLALWAIEARPALWALVAAYAVAWLVLSVVSVRWPAWRTAPIGRVQAWALAAAVAIAPGAALVRAIPAIGDADAISGVVEITRDRLRLERTPSIAPALVSDDRPQTLYVHAPGAGHVTVGLGRGVRALEATSLGSGLFRAEYDPRRDGAVRPVGGAITAVVTADGDPAERELGAVKALAHPRWLDASPDAEQVAAASEETDEIVLVGRGGGARRVPVGDGPVGAVFVLGGRAVAVAHRYTPELWLVEAASGRVLRRIATEVGAVHLAASPSGSRVAITQDAGAGAVGVRVVELSASASQSFLTLASAPEWIVFGSSDEVLVASSRQPAVLYRLAHGTGGWTNDVEPLRLGRPAVVLSRSRDGADVWAATTDLREDGRAHLGNHFVVDQLVSVDVSAWRVAGAYPTERRTARQTRAGDIDRGASPIGIAQRPDGALVVAFAGTDDVWIWTPELGRPWIVAVEAAGLSAPHGVAALAGGWFAVSSPSSGTIGIYDEHARLARAVELAPDDGALLAQDEVALRRRWGERVFYEAARAGISCQSCHLHGGSDFAAHNLGDRRLVPTLDTRGLAGTAPYLRDGSYARLVDLAAITDRFRGYRTRIGDRAAMLAAFIEAMPREQVPRAHGRDLARERRGVAAFVRARCPTCHSFPAFTNLGAHAVATVFPDAYARFPTDELIDTPSLFGVGATAPFLADGRAKTLRAVLRDENRANAHGDTRALDEHALGDLVYFLEGL